MGTSAQLVGQPDLEDLAIRLQQQQPPPASIAAPVQMPSAPPDLSIGQTPHPAVKAPRGTVEGDTAERSRMLGTGAGVDQIAGKIEGSGLGQAHPLVGKILGGLAQGVAKLGDVGLSAVAPALAINLPGTEYHHMAELHGLNKQIGAEEGEREKEAQTASFNAEVPLRNAQTQHEQAETEQIPENAAAKQSAADAALAQHGLKRVKGEDGEDQIVADESSPAYQHQQLALELTKSTLDLRRAQADFEKTKGDPNSVENQQAAQRLAIAKQTQDRLSSLAGAMQERADAQMMNATREAKGTDMQGNPLPGAMLTDEGQPVGSSQAVNVRPTGTQRSKGNMAASADQQINDMKEIVAKRPDVFGPAAGRVTDFSTWVGSQDPDAQRFRAARTIAGDHLAGTFGGRSEAALNALDAAIGHFKDNPAAITAGLNQLQEANRLFLKAGQVRTVGSNTAKGEGSAPAFKVKLSDAMALPQNKGKSDAEVEADVKKHGGEVVR